MTSWAPVVQVAQCLGYPGQQGEVRLFNEARSARVVEDGYTDRAIP
jgi:hypothetical protein